MRSILAALVLLLIALPALGQGEQRTNYSIQGYPAAELPANCTSGRIYQVFDHAGGSDCRAGGGTLNKLCVCQDDGTTLTIAVDGPTLVAPTYADVQSVCIDKMDDLQSFTCKVASGANYTIDCANPLVWTVPSDADVFEDNQRYLFDFQMASLQVPENDATCAGVWGLTWDTSYLNHDADLVIANWHAMKEVGFSVVLPRFGLIRFLDNGGAPDQAGGFQNIKKLYFVNSHLGQFIEIPGTYTLGFHGSFNGFRFLSFDQTFLEAAVSITEYDNLDCIGAANPDPCCSGVGVGTCAPSDGNNVLDSTVISVRNSTLQGSKCFDMKDDAANANSMLVEGSNIQCGEFGHVRANDFVYRGNTNTSAAATGSRGKFSVHATHIEIEDGPLACGINSDLPLLAFYDVAQTVSYKARGGCWSDESDPAAHLFEALDTGTPGITPPKVFRAELPFTIDPDNTAAENITINLFDTALNTALTTGCGAGTDGCNFAVEYLEDPANVRAWKVDRCVNNTCGTTTYP